MHDAAQDENSFLEDTHDDKGDIIAHGKVRHDRDGNVLKRDILGEHKSYEHYIA